MLINAGLIILTGLTIGLLALPLLVAVPVAIFIVGKRSLTAMRSHTYDKNAAIYLGACIPLLYLAYIIFGGAGFFLTEFLR